MSRASEKKKGVFGFRVFGCSGFRVFFFFSLCVRASRARSMGAVRCAPDRPQPPPSATPMPVDYVNLKKKNPLKRERPQETRLQVWSSYGSVGVSRRSHYVLGRLAFRQCVLAHMLCGFCSAFVVGWFFPFALPCLALVRFAVRQCELRASTGRPKKVERTTKEPTPQPEQNKKPPNKGRLSPI